MSARRAIRGKWCSMAILIAFAVVMLAAFIMPAMAVTDTPDVLATEVQTDMPVTGDVAAPAGTETGDKEAFGIGDDTGTDENTPAQTEKKGISIFVLVGMIVGAIIIVLVLRRKNT